MVHRKLKSRSGVKGHVLLKLGSVLPQTLVCSKGLLLTEASGESSPVFQVKAWLLG